LQDDYRDELITIFEYDDDQEVIPISENDYCTMAVFEFLKEKSAGANLERIQYFVMCISEFAKAKGMNTKDAFDYLYAHEGIEFLYKSYDVMRVFPPENAVEGLIQVCKNNGGSIA
jgi:hypothetical protein